MSFISWWEKGKHYDINYLITSSNIVMKKVKGSNHFMVRHDNNLLIDYFHHFIQGDVEFY